MDIQMSRVPNGGHGPLDLNGAMATSCNIYFMRLGGEIRGIRASRETKIMLHEYEYDRTWFPADTAQSAIGQFDNCFTIMQLCRYTLVLPPTSSVTPYVIDNVTAVDGTILYEGQTQSVPLDIKLKIISKP